MGGRDGWIDEKEERGKKRDEGSRGKRGTDNLAGKSIDVWGGMGCCKQTGRKTAELMEEENTNRTIDRPFNHGKDRKTYRLMTKLELPIDNTILYLVTD